MPRPTGSFGGLDPQTSPAFSLASSSSDLEGSLMGDLTRAGDEVLSAGRPNIAAAFFTDPLAGTVSLIGDLGGSSVFASTALSASEG